MSKQIDYWTGKPHPVSNHYVPQDAEIIGQVSYGSGELIYTYYCQRYEPVHPDHGHWAFWKVADWIDSVPSPTNMAEIEANGLIPESVQSEYAQACARWDSAQVCTRGSHVS